MNPDDFAEFQAFLEWRRSKGAAPVAVSGPTIDELWEKYERVRAIELPSWKYAHAVHKRHLIGHFDDARKWQPGAFYKVRWNDDMINRLDDYIDKRKTEWALNTVGGPKQRHISINTIGHEVTTLRAMLNWCKKRRFIPENPINGYDSPEEPTADIEPWTSDELALLIEHAVRPLWRLMFALYLETGMRRDEIRLLVWDEVNMETMKFKLPKGLRTKNRKGREIPISDIARLILQAVPRYPGVKYVFPSPTGAGGPCSEGAVDYWHRQTEIAAGIPHKKLHTTKHTFGSVHSTRYGTPIYVLMKWMGHSDKAVHDKYTNMSRDNSAAQQAWINGGRKGPQPQQPEKLEPIAGAVLRFIGRHDD